MWLSYRSKFQSSEDRAQLQAQIILCFLSEPGSGSSDSGVSQMPLLQQGPAAEAHVSVVLVGLPNQPACNSRRLFWTHPSSVVLSVYGAWYPYCFQRPFSAYPEMLADLTPSRTYKPINPPLLNFHSSLANILPASSNQVAATWLFCMSKFHAGCRTVVTAGVAS